MAHHEPYKALGAIAWDDVESADLGSLFDASFSAARILVNSVPAAAAGSPPSAASAGRRRSATDSAALTPHMVVVAADAARDAAEADAAATLRREWKEVRAGAAPRDNPHAIAVYKMGGRDGGGTWFARRSVHAGLAFDRWRRGLEAELPETLLRRPAGGEPGTGNIRGIGAERTVEQRVLAGKGQLKVYQLSAQFPGPTTPRDFVTLLLTSEADKGPDAQGGNRRRAPRQFITVSKPCKHPACPPRQAFIRGQYESVEVIREVPVDKPLRRTRSTIDLSREEGTKSGPKDTDAMRKTLLRNAQETAGDDDDPDLAANASSRKVAFVTPPMASSQSDVGAGEDADEPDMAVEWLMVTRSDPGGSVPRFIVEKGTPSGIVNDANRFVTWLLSSNSADDSAADDERAKDGEMLDEASVKAATIEPAERWSDRVSCSPARPAEEPAPTGFFGMIAGALGAAGIAGSAMTTSRGTMSSKDLDGHDSDDGSETRTETESHLSSALDYASAEEGETLPPLIAHDGMPDDGHSVRSKGSDVSQQSRSVATDSVAAAAGATAGAMVQHEKELRKIEERYRRAQEKVAKMQQAKKQKEGGGGGGADQDQRSQEAAALSKLQEKHKRDMARQEERYRRGLEKLEARRAAEERKAAERRRKAQERQDRANVAAELERARAERDVARKQIEMLTVQVGELQRQNTALAARIGRLQGPGEAL